LVKCRDSGAADPTLPVPVCPIPHATHNSKTAQHRTSLFIVELLFIEIGEPECEMQDAWIGMGPCRPIPCISGNLDRLDILAKLAGF
jgi:hypothetical protein